MPQELMRSLNLNSLTTKLTFTLGKLFLEAATKEKDYIKMGFIQTIHSEKVKN